MRNKLLYFLITLFGAATLVSGYQLTTNNEQRTIEIKKNSEIPTIDDNDQKSTNHDQQVTGYKLQDEKQKISTNTVTKPDTPTTDEINPEEIFEAKVTLQINNKNFPIPYEEDMTAEEVMKEVRSRYPESFSYESIEYGGDLGTFVKSINGIVENNREKMYWILYINGNKSNKGISILKLKPDDIIMWNYEKEIL